MLLFRFLLRKLVMLIIQIIIGLFVSSFLFGLTPAGKRIAAEEAKKRKIEEERLAKERANEIKRHIDWRDGDSQYKPYIYDCIGHPNATLAIRYGIANLKKEVKEYWYHGKGGEKMRNSDRDTISIVPASTIQLQKIRKVKSDAEGSHYLAKLTDFGNREVIVVIKPRTEYVQTFYPMSEDWFKKYADLELVLKDNKTFDLKELAHFHVQKVVINS